MIEPYVQFSRPRVIVRSWKARRQSHLPLSADSAASSTVCYVANVINSSGRCACSRDRGCSACARCHCSARRRCTRRNRFGGLIRIDRCYHDELGGVGWKQAACSAGLRFVLFFRLEESMCVSFFQGMETLCTYRIGSSATHAANMCTRWTYAATA